jgi:hypothetical protein
MDVVRLPQDGGVGGSADERIGGPVGPAGVEGGGSAMARTVDKTGKILKELRKLREEKIVIENRLTILEDALIAEARNQETLWDKHQAAAYLKVSERHLDDMRAAGKIRARNISGSIRFDPEEIRGYGLGEPA